jgi:hypothetical protein
MDELVSRMETEAAKIVSDTARAAAAKNRGLQPGFLLRP